MPQTDFLDGAKSVQQDAGDFLASANAIGSDITANPKGEGTYRMVGPKGAVQIPYSSVSSAQGQGFKFGTSGDADRWHKDNQVGMSLLDKAKDNFKWNTREVAGDGSDTGGSAIGAAIQNLGGTAAKDIISPIAHPIDTVKGLANTAGQLVMHGSELGPDNPINQVIGNAVTALRDDPRKALAQGAGHVAAGVLTDKVLAPGAVKAVGAVADAPAAAGRFAARTAAGSKVDEVIPGTNITPRMRYNAAKEMGVNLDLAQATEGTAAKAAKRPTEHSLGGSQEFEQNNAANIEALHGHIDKVLNDTAPPMSREQFGTMVQGKLHDYQQEMNEAAGDIFTELDKKYGPEKQMTSALKDEAAKIVSQNKDYFEKYPQMLSGGTRRAWETVKNLADSKAPATWSDLHRLRSDLMDITRGPEMVADRAVGWLKNLTGKVDTAMTNPAAMDAQSLQQFRDANAIYAKMKGTFDNPQSQIFHIARSPDGLTSSKQIMGLKPADMRFLQEAAPDAITQIQRQTMSRILSPAGNDIPELSTLGTRFSRAQKEQLRAVLTPEQIKHLEDIDHVSRVVRLDSNTSGSGKVLQAQKEGTALVAGPFAGAAAAASGHPFAGTVLAAAPYAELGGTKAISKLLTSPKVVEAVMKHSGEVPAGGPGKWASVGATNLNAHINTAPQSGLTVDDIKALQDNPKAQSILWRASGLKPGSKQMSALIDQARALLSTK